MSEREREKDFGFVDVAETVEEQLYRQMTRPNRIILFNFLPSIPINNVSRGFGKTRCETVLELLIELFSSLRLDT